MKSRATSLLLLQPGLAAGSRLSPAPTAAVNDPVIFHRLEDSKMGLCPVGCGWVPRGCPKGIATNEMLQGKGHSWRSRRPADHRSPGRHGGRGEAEAGTPASGGPAHAERTL